MTPKEALKGAKVFAYGRVSTVKQEGSLNAQKAAVKEALESKGYKKDFDWVAHQFSGAKHERDVLIDQINKAVASKKKGNKVVFVVRDFQRFSRDPYDVGYLYKFMPSHEESLWFNDIPIISLNDAFVTGTKSTASPNADLIAPILVAAGGSEISIRKEQSQGGLAVSAEEGIIAGTPRNLYYKEPLNPMREYVRMFRAGVKQGKIATRLGRSPSWAKDTKSFFNDTFPAWNQEGKNKLLEDWLLVTDIIREFEQAHGSRTGRDATKRMIAISRKTSGYLKFPNKYPAPSREEIQGFYDDFKLYQPKRR
jgi:DNA invertase Pin-like site-specific DNA recombinase